MFVLYFWSKICISVICIVMITITWKQIRVLFFQVLKWNWVSYKDCCSAAFTLLRNCNSDLLHVAGGVWKFQQQIKLLQQNIRKLSSRLIKVRETQKKITPTSVQMDFNQIDEANLEASRLEDTAVRWVHLSGFQWSMRAGVQLRFSFIPALFFAALWASRRRVLLRPGSVWICSEVALMCVAVVLGNGFTTGGAKMRRHLQWPT